MNVSQIYRAAGLLTLSAALSLSGAAGCKKQGKKDSTAAAAASASPSGSASGESGAPAKLAGPCGEFADKFCKEAGEKSASCKGAQDIAQLLSDSACTEAVKSFAVTTTKLKAQRAKCEDLVTTLCAAVGKDTETCKMVSEKTASFPPEQCEKMLGQKDKIIEDLKKQEARNQPLTAEQQAAVAADDAPSFGPKDAKVTVVEFSDFECPYCSKAAKVTEQLRKEYGDKIRFVFRQFPLSFHKNAKPAAEAALAAHAQGKFWEYHDLLFENSRKLDKESLAQYATKTGVDAAKLKAALDANTYGEAVDRDMKLGEQASVSGTPTMFVNGKRVGNPTDFKAVSEAIDAALKM
jgi:protein-disulfide isomerase